MQRRKLLVVGAATGVLLTLAGAGAALLRQARLDDGRFSQGSEEVMSAVAATVLEGLLPAEPTARAVQIRGLLQRLQTTVSGFPPAMQAEVDELLGLLAHPAGRVGLAGLLPDWTDATTSQLQAAMRGLQTSSILLRQQVFHALRDLTNAAYFAEPATWAQVGYPGPRPV